MKQSIIDQQRRDAEYKVKLDKLLNTRCKHGLKFESCAFCNEVEVYADVKVWIDKVDPDTGEVTGKFPITHHDVKRVSQYNRWR
jgi:hypothetical protein